MRGILHLVEFTVGAVPSLIRILAVKGPMLVAENAREYMLAVWSIGALAFATNVVHFHVIGLRRFLPVGRNMAKILLRISCIFRKME